jgi:hypothetical protein
VRRSPSGATILSACDSVEFLTNDELVRSYVDAVNQQDEMSAIGLRVLCKLLSNRVHKRVAEALFVEADANPGLTATPGFSLATTSRIGLRSETLISW